MKQLTTPVILTVAAALFIRNRSHSFGSVPTVEPPVSEAAPTALQEESQDSEEGKVSLAARLYGWAKDHFWLVSLSATGLTTALVLLKALIVGDGELATTSILLSEGIAGAALSCVIASLPFATLGAAFAAGASVAQAWREGVLGRAPLVILCLAAILAFLTAPWYLVCAAVALSITGVLMFASADADVKINHHGWLGFAILATTGVLTGMFVGQIVSLNKMWLPVESLTIEIPSASGSPAPAETPHQLVGYVVAKDGYYLTFLEESTRVVTYVETSSVIDRERCRLDSQEWSELPLPWGGASDKYDLCGEIR